MFIRHLASAFAETITIAALLLVATVSVITIVYVISQIPAYKDVVLNGSTGMHSKTGESLNN